MTSLKDAALGLARLGWFVFPVAPGGKTPLVKWRDESSIDPERIERWWGPAEWDADEERMVGWPDANIGVDCGASELVVVDIDDPRGLDLLEEQIGKLPATLTSRTGSGGTHCAYRADPDRPVRNSASKLAPGVDIRGDGGYIVVPPSKTDGAYQWTARVEPAPVPPALLDYIDSLAVAPPAPEPAPIPVALDALDRWGKAVLEGELAKIAAAPEGTRNDTLFACACKVYEAVKGGHIPRGVADQHLMDAGVAIGLGALEVERSLQQAWVRTGERHPTETVAAPLVPGLPTPGVDPKAPRRFPTYSRGELSKLPPPEWLIKGFLPEGITVVWGEMSLGKSFVALDISLTLAYLGKRVLYFAAEGAGAFHMRVTAWEEHHPHLSYDPERFLVVPQVPRLLHPEDAVSLHATVAELQPELVVIDTWQYAMAGANENDTGDNALAIAILNRLREYRTSILIVHHANKTGTIRGNDVLPNSADAAWRMRAADASDPAAGYHLSMHKPFKDGERAETIHGVLRRSGPSVVPYPCLPQRMGYGVRP